ncbi:MAG: hypothetical protein K2O31_03890 [Clostridia bacterium]|nr:hypothetical protein [Clostridia bacterium]
MEENTNGELTFRKIWQQIKKSGVRIIVYAFIAIIVCGGILGICDIFVSQSQYETRITYYYSGAELGENPWGGQEDVVSDIKSANNVSTALEKLQYSDEEKDALVNLIIRNLNVMSTVDKEVISEAGVLMSANYSYRIVLSQDPAIDKLLKSRNDYNNILSAVTTNHIETFKRKFSFSTSLGNLTVLDSYNAFQKYDTIRGYLNAFSEESKTWAEKAPAFVSTSQDMSFASLNTRIQMASQKLENYLNFILFNGINAHGETQYVELKLKEANDTIANCEEKLKTLNEVLAVIMQNYDVNLPSSGTIIVNPPAELKTVVDDISQAVSEKTLAQTDKNSWETRKTYFNSQDFDSKTEEQKNALINTANTLELEAINEYNALVDGYKLMIEEYNSGYNVSSLVRMTSVPTQSTNSPITVKIGLIVELMVLIIAVIIAMLVTSKKGAMVLKKKAAEESQEVVLIENSQVGDEEENAEPQGLPAQGLGDPSDRDIDSSEVE